MQRVAKALLISLVLAFQINASASICADIVNPLGSIFNKITAQESSLRSVGYAEVSLDAFFTEAESLVILSKLLDHAPSGELYFHRQKTLNNR